MSQISIYARDMYAAQGAKLTTEQRAILVAKADRFREITGTTERTNMNVTVRDVYNPQVVLGYVTYTL